MKRYLPKVVQRIIDRGTVCFVGLVDDETVLKYPCDRRELHLLEIESKLLCIAADHHRIIKSRGLADDGLLLEYASHGNIYDYIVEKPQDLR